MLMHSHENITYLQIKKSDIEIYVKSEFIYIQYKIEGNDKYYIKIQYNETSQLQSICDSLEIYVNKDNTYNVNGFLNSLKSINDQILVVLKVFIVLKYYLKYNSTTDVINWIIWDYNFMRISIKLNRKIYNTISYVNNDNNVKNLSVWESYKMLHKQLRDHTL